MQSFAAGMAYEEKLKGTNIQLAPMVSTFYALVLRSVDFRLLIRSILTDIARVPFGGRNFESFGEDPLLASRMVAANVKGIQSQGIMATVKHFVDNNQVPNKKNIKATNEKERTSS